MPHFPILTTGRIIRRLPVLPISLGVGQALLPALWKKGKFVGGRQECLPHWRLGLKERVGSY
jgi:hypothetical protein